MSVSRRGGGLDVVECATVLVCLHAPRSTLLPAVLHVFSKWVYNFLLCMFPHHALQRLQRDGLQLPRAALPQVCGVVLSQWASDLQGVGLPAPVAGP
eukprot:7861690-Pyramimonas_sp.AAC.1